MNRLFSNLLKFNVLSAFLLFNFCLFGQKFPTPSPAQIAWHETEFYLFIHFGPNTFTNKEWGEGNEPESVFNPAKLDCEQWARIAKQTGAKGIVITAKHHDGFCLWPSKFSKHTVRESPWKNGKGDVLRELSNACKKHGLKFGVYLSPWDRNHPDFGSKAYNDVYSSTLHELMTNYGNLFEIWWDGANGEGPTGKKQVYDFHRFEKEAAVAQPDAVIFSDIGPGCRWAGNEQGTVSETNWCTLDTVGFTRGAGGPPVERLQNGDSDGKNWIPAECDVSIRPGWFYHPEEDGKVKPSSQLFDIYMKSVGRGANLILNVPPDRNGLIHPNDSASLVAFGQKLKNTFGENFALGKKAHLIAPGGKQLNVNELVDGNRTTSPVFAEGSNPTIEIDLGQKRWIGIVGLQEVVEQGQRVKSFKVEALVGKDWKEVARSTTIGFRKYVSFKKTVARQIRVTILDSKATPLLGEILVFKG